MDGDGEYESSDATGKVIYVPMFSRVKVTAPGTANTQKFASWQIPSETPGAFGKVMCTTTSYTFYVVENMTLEASYVQDVILLLWEKFHSLQNVQLISHTE